MSMEDASAAEFRNTPFQATPVGMGHPRDWGQQPATAHVVLPHAEFPLNGARVRERSRPCRAMKPDRSSWSPIAIASVRQKRQQRTSEQQPCSDRARTPGFVRVDGRHFGGGWQIVRSRIAADDEYSM